MMAERLRWTDKRVPNRTKAMQAADEFWVVQCANCHHPGGLHIIVEWEPRITRCRCCPDCPSYVDGDYGVWSDARTAQESDG
jgi:hypothetical protein